MNTALITGASAGIGKTFAEELAKQGMNLVLVARSEDKLEQIAQSLRSQFQISVNIIPQDLSKPGSAEAVFNAVTAKGLAIDLLINNAGFGEYGPFVEHPRQKQVEMVQLNIIALMELTHLFLPGMQQRRSGSIINMSSVAAFQPIPYFSVYAATKAFILSFSEALWAENKDYGVQILAVCPGPTDTKFFKDAEFPEWFAGIPGQGYTPVEEVVREALAALGNNHPTVVTGGLVNQLLVNAPRFLPREVALNFVKQQAKK